MKTNILIFDTETIGKVTQDLINVGYQVVEIDTASGQIKVLQARDYLVGDLIRNKIFCLNDDFVGVKKFQKFEENLAAKKSIIRSVKQIFKTLGDDLKRYNVQCGYAYNCNFDIDKFAKTALRKELINPLANLQIFDIWTYATNYICARKDYQAWALKNGALTATKKFISTNVESVCRYLYRDTSFEEDHTALSDVQHETAILCECLRRGCDIFREEERAKLIRA